jgi:hypothetical protein
MSPISLSSEGWGDDETNEASLAFVTSWIFFF